VDDWSDDDWMEWIENTFEALDAKNVDAFVGNLTPGAEVRFGNGEPFTAASQFAMRSENSSTQS
jgi:hypothetical protein